MLEGKCALITGSGQGIGLEIATEFAKAGAKVMLNDINEDTLKESVESLTSQGFTVEGVVANVAKEEDVKNAIEETVKKFGRIDILVNNAGIQHVAPIEEFPSEKYGLILDIMLKGPFYGIKYAFPIMKEQGYGRILNMASINGLIGFAGKAGYNSAKHGVIGLTKVAALEGADYGITVNAICPGYVDTPLVQNQLEDLAKTRNIEKEKALEQVIYPLVPQKRLIQVQEVADYSIFLVSEKAKSITGQAAVIDGGYTAQ
ncbi:3-hydroxybutyrate dehydrogenase [Bacillus hwajinpoensis]|jgi:3-hydroxybutyrate dehydrogenase|uniref:3-hydroxybutyrate dehydrogenase n=1 Tax=Guptibacillus hwajinpoensis TaxID=208199 RepID=A0A845F2U3_9BACL|nr:MULTISPECIES: 3-hydroxybutyrate dehydrogenase [Bacillaceae]MCA0993743.1 3-hydroxybutyrate dehydrogenase [Pseudalkalibacillus hwajinpoensis]MYL65078.1 3-hydroxybutyrate dehydrogenase [Pseudalkalibacillus hwajinpoensis]PFG12149.1 3-hydroxybutyrate dehydrogenase [Bacillus sp. es.036]QHA90968.1 3-hydroxybutyrate dehydrogenase [Bacillus sp. N1-1]